VSDTTDGAAGRRVQRPRPSQRAASVSIAMKQSRRAEQEGGQVQSHATGMNAGLRVLSYLIAGVALYGGLGWLADRQLGTAFWLPLGIVLGAAFAVYTIIRRFGRVEDPGTLSLPKTTTGEGAR
jgi:F0F1-type ATP synthase assembly protein I